MKSFLAKKRQGVCACLFGIVIVTSWLLGENLCNAFQKKGKPLDLEKALATLRTSEDGLQLAMAAIAICHFHWDEDMDFLIEQLQKPDFLRKLDEEYISRRFASQFRLSHVLTAIGKISTSKAEKLLFQLADNKEFFSNRYRQEALVKAFGYIRDPSPRLLFFLDNMAQPSAAGHIIYLTIETLARVASPQTCKMIEKMVLSKDYKYDKQIWFTGFICPYRNDRDIVQLYKRLIKSDIKEAPLRNIIVQTLFDYRPVDWFDLMADYYLKPPPRENASLEVLQELTVIAELALKLDLRAETKAGVEKAQKEIRQLLRQRQLTAAMVPPAATAGAAPSREPIQWPWYGFLIASLVVVVVVVLCWWLARREMN